jgi:hypothetical protein
MLRKDYPLRREFSNYTVLLNKDDDQLINILKTFRFRVTTEKPISPPLAT